ncbi:MAG: inositol monophosphatase family protein, partial [Gaiellaceae bacterium]
TKPDATPVTDADRAVERALRELVARERPGEGVNGEEEGDDGGSTRWVVDPIDGTRNFLRGVPVWATLVALEREGRIVCGVASAPALRRRWWASAGHGAWSDAGAVRVSAVTTLADASVSCAHGRDLASLEQRVWHARGLGDFWQHVLVAEGAVDAVVDAELKLWDYAAVALIVEEAGGRTTALDGAPPRPGEQVVSSNGAVHDELLAAIL